MLLKFSCMQYALKNCFSTNKHHVYDNTIRGNYKNITSKDVDQFKKILSDPTLVVTDKDMLDSYNTDWLSIFKGKSSLLLRPKTTQHVQGILKYCNEERIAVVPQGGNTSLVGGSVPVFDEVILSTKLMNKIEAFQPESGILVCQVGCVVEQINNFLKSHGSMLGHDLGSKGSCNIGGNVSTNAGGIRLLRYGSLFGSVLGIEAVKADGTKLDLISTNRKDNVGFHMRHLFIGSEGTLGVVTKVSILCPKIPSSVNLAIISCSSFDKVLKILKIAKENLNEILSAFEFVDRDSLEVTEVYLKEKLPLEKAPFVILVETSGSIPEHDQQKLDRFLEKLEKEDLMLDGTVAFDLKKIEHLWKFRESIALALLLDGHVYKYDISLPQSHFYTIVDEMKNKLGSSARRVCGYGHVGDGNLHFNVTSEKYDRKLNDNIENFLYDFVVKEGGSISAEHGVGLFKRDKLHLGRTPQTIGLMREIKLTMDPNLILNPYKVLSF